MSKSINHGDTSRRFPHYGWAWPQGSTEQLLRAAALSDEGTAKKLFTHWMQANNIDDVTWAEQRLLLAIAARFPKDAVKVANRPRLNGLVRVFWTKSRLSLRAAEPAIKKLQEARIDVLVFKGAARAARSTNTLKGRVANDVDILVHPEQFKAAINTLASEGWEAANGWSIPHCLSLAEGITGLNFFKDDFGDIDLHQSAYHELGPDRSNDVGLWERSLKVDFLGSSLRIPDATDELVIAIAHGGIDGHMHSDWVVDCHSHIATGNIDWDLFSKLVGELTLVPHAAIVLTFLRQRLGSDIPAYVLKEIISKGRHPRIEYLAALLQARPQKDHSGLSDLGRSFFKQARLRKKRSLASIAYKTKPLITKMSCQNGEQNQKTIEEVEELEFDVPANINSVQIAFYISLRPQKRRYEFDLIDGQRHVSRLTIKSANNANHSLLTANVPLHSLGEKHEPYTLKLQSRPWKTLRPEQKKYLDATYGAVPFALKSISFT